MAHLRSIVIECRVYGCTSRASQAVYSCWNEPIGSYCKKHAPAALRDQQRHEGAFLTRNDET